VNLFISNYLGESERAERFAACPPAFGLLLYLRKALSPLALANIVSRQLFRSFIFSFAATGVVRLPQRSKGGGRRPGDMSGGGRTAPVAGSAIKTRAQKLNSFRTES
jgi:hypothetical protein